MKNTEFGTFYIVGTPIGNLGDISLRALETLRTVDVIAAEDTRHTRLLLNHYQISKRLLSYREHNEREATETIKSILLEKKSVALVSDAGMPGISDPGAVAVRELRESGFDIVVIPGPTAVTTAMSISGLEHGRFLFIGFLPDKLKARTELVESFKDISVPLVLYSAPHDVSDDIAFLYKVLGDRAVIVVKELTKVFESVYTGSLGNIVIDNMKGEFVIIVQPSKKTNVNSEQLIDALNKYLINGFSNADAVKAVATDFSVPRNAVYALLLSVKKD
ncbi:MAG: 16S rRNA (cytidine(1402)-2'-O)-methyltransferase [Christensenellaceae bacterium]|jgi:16S rRNA (cytidine1402-2'-O)-methyltransferase|nr:16S rRNA (cytidine(1402)-2'-O)-methyltransferase [Christensenellaceae bacterium]